MDEKYKVFIEHLEYLGSEITENKDEDEIWFSVIHPSSNFTIHFSGIGLFHRVYLPLKKSLKKEDKITINEFINKSNYEASISQIFSNKKVLVLGGFYNGEYSKLYYGRFLEGFLSDVNEWIVKCQKKIDKLIDW